MAWKVLNIAHRGASSLAPENTIIAFEKAAELQVDAVEMDIRLSKDQQIVVIHDDTVERTTDGRGHVSDLTLAELKNLDAGGWFGDEFRGTKIPTLEEVIATLKNKTMLWVEVKQQGMEEKLLKLLYDYNVTHSVVVISFILPALSKIRRLHPQIATGALFGIRGGAKRITQHALSHYADIVNIPKGKVTRKIINDAHLHGLTVGAWTVNKEKEMRKLIALGVDAITTDYPQRLNEVIGERKQYAQD